MQKTLENAESNQNTDDEAFASSDFSVFRTRLPRPTTTMWHLAIAAISFVLALVAAIYYAER